MATQNSKQAPPKTEEMEKIEHSTVRTNGINMHVASIGSGPDTILFLHGFPELWYSWRHQLLSLSSLGYRAIAPDMRGYGDTDAPPSSTSYTTFHLVGDLVGLLDALSINKVFLVGHDWGALVAWDFCLFRPDRVRALVNLSVVFVPRNPNMTLVDGFRALLGDDFYMCRFQEVGEAEEDFAKVETADLFKYFLTAMDPTTSIIPNGFSALCKSKLPITLPSWLTEEEVSFYAKKFDKTGFTGGLNYYRAMHKSWELTAAYMGSQVKVPTKFIIGDHDITYHFPGFKDFIDKGDFKKCVPDLQEVVVMEGATHFINQEKPNEINAHIYDFFKKF